MERIGTVCRKQRNVDKKLASNIPRKIRKYWYHEILTGYYLERTFRNQKRT